MNRITDLMQAGIIFTCLLLSGCGGEPFNYEPPNELKPGPGLFSGEDGEFNLIGAPEKKEENNEQEGAKKGDS